MDFLLAQRNRERLADRRWDEINLGGVFSSFGVAVLFFFLRFPLRQKGNPTAIGGPLRLGVVTRLRELSQSSVTVGIIAIEPEIFAEDALVPVGTKGPNDYRAAVRGDFHVGEADKVKKFVERELGFIGGVGRENRKQE